MSEQESILAALDAAGIKYVNFSHAPAMTAEEHREIAKSFTTECVLAKNLYGFFLVK